MNRLTAQQQAVYDFVRQCIFSRGYGPTVREIGEHMAIKSPNGVMSHLRALERKGVISRSAKKSRAIELTDPVVRPQSKWQIRGSITSSRLKLAKERNEFVDTAIPLFPDICFLIEIQDDSLSTWKIQTGDHLVVKPLKGAVQGQVLLAQDERQETFGIGRGTTSGASVLFHPIVGTMTQRILSDGEIIGAAVGVLRSFDRNLG